MDLAMQVKGLAGRQEFWSELACAAPQDVLARLGGALCACAVVDGQVESVMRCAADRANRRIDADSGLSDGAAPPRLEAGSGEAAPVSSPSRCLVRPGPPSESDQGSASEGSDDGSGSEAGGGASVSWLAVALPWPHYAGLLPGLGSSGSRNAWLAFFVVLSALEGSLSVSQQSSEIAQVYSSGGKHIAMVSKIVFVAFYIALLCGIDGMAHHARLRAALRDRCYGSAARRSDWRRFTYKACVAAVCLFAVFIVLEVSYILKRSGALLAGFFAWFRFVVVILHWTCFHLSIVMFVLIFAVAWKITWDEVCEFCARLESGSMTDWAMEMCHYDELHRFVAEIWCVGYFAYSMSAFLLVMGVEIFLLVTMPLILGKVGASLHATVTVWVLIDLGLLCAALYAMAKLQKKCVSTRLADNSLLTMGLRVAGRIPWQQRADLGMFLHCVMWNPLGVHVFPVGKVSMKMMYYYVRFAIVAVPAWVGFVALHSDNSQGS